MAKLWPKRFVAYSLGCGSRPAFDQRGPRVFCNAGCPAAAQPRARNVTIARREVGDGRGFWPAMRFDGLFCGTLNGGPAPQFAIEIQQRSGILLHEMELVYDLVGGFFFFNLLGDKPLQFNQSRECSFLER